MGNKDEMKKEDVVQAVIVADSFNSESFNTSFAPLTKDGPSCLLPLAGRPLLDYTLQCLAKSGVQDVIIYLTTNSSKVKSWLKTSPWDSNFSAAPFTVSSIVNEDCRSFGDAMRDLYDKGILRHDFILVSGDLVSNLNLAPYLAKHKQIMAKDKKAIMTSVYSKGYQGNPLRCKGSELVLATDKESDEVLFYQKSNAKTTLFPIELFQHDQVNVYFDILDSGIYICSPILLSLFSDNFDIQDMDRMVNEIIESELIDSTIYMQVSNSDFSSRVSNPYLYGLVHEKVLNRWVYPIVPERRILGKTDKVCVLNNSVYKSSSARIAKGTRIGQNTYVGNRVNIEPGCTINQSSLEDEVKIGENTSVSVGENVEIPDGVEINGKVIVGHHSILHPEQSIPEGTRISSVKESDGFSDDEGEGQVTMLEGEYGPCAFNYVVEDEDQDFEDEDEKDVGASNWGEVYVTDDEGSELSDDDDDNNDLNDSWADNDLSDGEELEDGMENEEDGEHDDVKNFKREVMESLQRAETDGNIVTDNLVLEINSSKHAWNTTLCEVNQCVLESVLTLETDFTLPPAKLLAKLKANIMKFKQLLLKYSQSKSGQDYYLSSVPELIKRFPPILEVIAKVLHLLYELDILGEDAILKWSSKLQDTSIKSKIQGFLDWLDEDDSDESGSSEEEDSD